MKTLMAENQLQAILAAAQAEPGALILMVADRPEVANPALANLRLEIGRRTGQIDPDVLAFCWVVDFPLLEWNEEEGRWQAVHHPFTSAVDEDWDLLETDPARVRAKAYDIVLNGWEIGGGSIRIHRQDQQMRLFHMLGLSEAEVAEKFGHMLEAFQYGAPPHGGIALGLDRLVAIFANEPSIREVIAFPKTSSAQDLMLGAPAPVSEDQLRELHLAIVDVEEPTP